MSSISGIRLSGLATGMDTDAMVKSMTTADQEKVDKAQQKEQTIKWQQEIYREVMSDVMDFNDKYFSLTSKDSIVNSSAWNTLSISSTNSSVITATGNAGASNVDYKFNVTKLAEPAKAQSSIVDLKKDNKIADLQAKNPGVTYDTKFKIELGKDEQSNPIYSNTIEIEPDETIETLINKINNSTDGKVKASYSEMTGKFTIETKATGVSSEFKIVREDGKASNALDFLGLQTKDSGGNLVKFDANGAKGSNSEIEVLSKDGTFIKTLSEESNTFTIDGIRYNVNSVGSAEITSTQDTSAVVQKMKSFVDDYNKIMDKVYDLVTEKTNKDYQPLTEAQKEEMSEKEIEKWEEKAKEGILRNDSEMRKFMSDMENAIFGDKMDVLREMGISTHDDYNKKGQLALDESKLIAALQNDSEKVYEVFAKGPDSMMDKMKSTIKNYVGSSSSIFAKKAGIEKTASAANNFYSEQLKRQAELIKKLQNKLSDKEEKLYLKFGSLESQMNKLNSQMNYFMQ